MEKMRILFLGCLVPNNLEQEVHNKNINSFQNSATNFQKLLIKGLEENNIDYLSICNLLPVSSYPRFYKDIYIKKSYFSHNGKSKDINAGFLNLHIIKNLFLYRYFYSCVVKMMSEKKYNTIICYSANKVFIKAIKHIKKKNRLKSCMIIPDLPEFNDLSKNQSFLYRLLLKYNSYFFKKNLKYFDSFVYVTKQTNEYLNNRKPFVVIEGIYNFNIINTHNYKLDFLEEDFMNKGYKIITYTGTTNEQFGILRLLEAFKRIGKEDYRLLIIGCGDADYEIKKSTLIDKRIVFPGVLPSEIVWEIQKKSTVLINPRNNTGEYTKYSFPSKIIEYLSSGTPVIAYKLDGIPSEYDKYIYYVKDDTIKSLMNSIKEMCEKSEKNRRIIGISGKQFVQNKKNSTYQCKKIIDMLEEIRGYHL